MTDPLRAPFFSIHVLAEDQKYLADRFTRGGAQFDGLDCQPSPEGVATLPGVLTRFDCAQETAHDAGDHTLVIGRVLRVETAPGQPLVFAQGRWGGHRPD